MWEGVIVEKMLFEDCPVCHDPLLARISSSRESPPPPWRSRQACARWARAFAGSKFETMASGSNHTMHPYAIRENRRRRQAWPCFSLVVNVQSTFFVTFCQFRRKLVRHRVTRRTRNQDVFLLFITRGLESLRQFGAGTEPSYRRVNHRCFHGRFLSLVLQVLFSGWHRASSCSFSSSSPRCLNLPTELEECLGKVSQQVRCSVLTAFFFFFSFFLLLGSFYPSHVS